jgi:hypothetical protein
MIAPRNLVLLQFILITIALNGLLGSCTGDSSKTDKTVELQKSKAGQIYQWTETEGKDFLTHMRQTITTPEAWEKRANQIRTHILQAADLYPMPDKCPLNPIVGEIRKYDGYQVENVSFESLPGVFVSGSLYSPTGVIGIIPGIQSPQGQWPNQED